MRRLCAEAVVARLTPSRLVLSASQAVVIVALLSAAGVVIAAPPGTSASPPALTPAPPIDARAQPDIYFVWRDGSRLAAGQNPCEAILSGNMQENRKYPTYFPLYYLLVAGAHRLGVTEYRDWMRLWRPLVLLTHFGITVLL